MASNVLIYSAHNSGSGIYIHLLTIRTPLRSRLSLQAAIQLIVLKPEFYSHSRLAAELESSRNTAKEGHGAAHVKGMSNDKQEQRGGH
jgi:hypothetical protein